MLRPALALVALILLPPPAHALVEIGRFGSQVNQVEVADGHLVTTTLALELVAYDLSDPLAPAEVGSHAFPIGAQPTQLVVRDGLAYVSAGNGIPYGTGSLRIVDVSVPAAPAEVGSIATLRQDARLAVGDGVVFATDLEAGIQAIDVSNPAAPVLLTHFGPPGGGTHRIVDVALVGTILYAVEEGDFPNHGVHVFDVSNPAAPAYLTLLQAGGDPASAQVIGPHLYVTSLAQGSLRPSLYVFDIATPAAPVSLASNFELHGSKAASLALRQDDIALFGSGGAVDLSDPSAPVALGYLAQGATDVAVLGDVAYFAEGSFSRPTSPQDIYAVPGGAIVDASLPELPRRLHEIGIGGATGLDVSGNVVYGAAASQGLVITYVGDPESPQEVGVYDTSGDANDVDVVGTIAHIADGAAGLVLVDVSDPFHPALRSAIPLPVPANEIAVAGGRAYVSGGVHGIAIVDVHNPVAPAVLTSFGATNAKGLTLRGSRLYFANGGMGLAIYDVSDPVDPEYLGRFPCEALDVAVAGTIAYVVADQDVLIVVDVSDPENPVQVGPRYPVQTTTGQNDFAYPWVAIELSGRLLHVGAEVFDVSDPADLRRLGRPYGGDDRPGIEYPADVATQGTLRFMAWGSRTYIDELGPEFDPGPPLCDVEVGQATYTDGEVLGMTALRFHNPLGTALATRLRLRLDLPLGFTIDLLDLGAGGGFAISPGFDLDLAPVTMFTVQPGQPRGTYTLRCLLEDPVGGTVQAQDEAAFAFE